LGESNEARRLLNRLILLFSVLTAMLLAAPYQYCFQKLSVAEGSSQSSILTIIQDQDGYFWFGTYEGLNRYNGYHFKVFKPDREDYASISHYAVQALFSDREGNLNTENICLASWVKFVYISSQLIFDRGANGKDENKINHFDFYSFCLSLGKFQPFLFQPLSRR